MGRAKLSMELINSEKARHTTFQKRKKGLKKKTYELKTLCGVEVCLIIYGPNVDGRPLEPEIWPQNCEEIQELIDVYKKQSIEDRKRRTSDLSNFFEDRNRKVEEAVLKLKTKNNEAKYPTWDDRYNDLSDEDLKEFLAILENKIQQVKGRVDEFISYNPRFAAPAMVDPINMESSNPNDSHIMQGLFTRRDMQLEVVHEQKTNSHEGDLIPIHHPFYQQNRQTLQFDGSSNKFASNHFDRQIYYDPSMVGMNINNMVVANNIPWPPPPMGYYDSKVQPFVAPFVQYPMLSSNASSQMHCSQILDEYYQLSHDLHDMKYQN